VACLGQILLRKTDFPYKMKGETLQKVDHQPYLGVELSNNLKYNLHIDQSYKKASKVLGFLKRNLKHCPSSVKDRAYTSLVVTFDLFRLCSNFPQFRSFTIFVVLSGFL
jgi:hypothetical protein